MYGLNCWHGFNDIVWDCDDFTNTYAPPPPELQDENAMQAMALFQLQHDARGPDGRQNDLKGTCHIGELLAQGYEQEIINGQHLRDAYISYDEVNALTLFHDEDTYPWEHGQIYIRSDDQQRTLTSGETLVRGLLQPDIQEYFGEFNKYPILNMHTKDGYSALAPSELACPRLLQIYEEYLETEHYKINYEQSNESHELAEFVTKKFDRDFEQFDAIDCLATIMCTDRELPKPVNDFSPTNNNTWFSRLFQYDIDLEWDYLMYDDAAYAKLASAPLWREIFTDIEGIIYDDETVCCPKRKPPKMAIFSGHDITIMPLLASIGLNDTKWAVYASMVVLEIHKLEETKTLFPSGFAFRILYEGKVLTPSVNGCLKDAELCDWRILVDIVSQFIGSPEWHSTACERDGSDWQESKQAYDDDNFEVYHVTHTSELQPPFDPKWILVFLLLLSSTLSYLYLLWKVSSVKDYAVVPENDSHPPKESLDKEIV